MLYLKNKKSNKNLTQLAQLSDILIQIFTSKFLSKEYTLQRFTIRFHLGKMALQVFAKPF